MGFIHHFGGCKKSLTLEWDPMIVRVVEDAFVSKAKDSNQKDCKFEEMKQKMNRKSIEGCFGCPPFLDTSWRRDFLIKSPPCGGGPWVVADRQTRRQHSNQSVSVRMSKLASTYLQLPGLPPVWAIVHVFAQYHHKHHIFVYILDEIERTGLTCTTPLKGS